MQTPFAHGRRALPSLPQEQLHLRSFGWVFSRLSLRTEARPLHTPSSPGAPWPFWAVQTSSRLTAPSGTVLPTNQGYLLRRPPGSRRPPRLGGSLLLHGNPRGRVRSAGEANGPGGQRPRMQAPSPDHEALAKNATLGSRSTRSASDTSLSVTPTGGCDGASPSLGSGGPVTVAVNGVCGGDATGCPRLGHSVWVSWGPSRCAVRKPKQPTWRDHMERPHAGNPATGPAEVPVDGLHQPPSPKRTLADSSRRKRLRAPGNWGKAPRHALSKHLPHGSHEHPPTARLHPGRGFPPWLLPPPLTCHPNHRVTRVSEAQGAGFLAPTPTRPGLPASAGTFHPVHAAATAPSHSPGLLPDISA